MQPRLRVAKSGNLVETIEFGLGKRAHRVVFDTSVLGDRRVRKAAARAELAKRTPAPRVYYTYTMEHFTLGTINSISGTITIKV